MMESGNRRPEIHYPCRWEYKIIGTDVNKILSAVENCVLGLEYSVSPSNVSRNGIYYSFNISVMVPNEVVRDLVFEKLQKSEHINFVI